MISLVFQNPPNTLGLEVLGTPKGILRRCLGVQISSQEVFGCLGFNLLGMTNI